MRALLLTFALACGCGPTAQALVHLDTDAPVTRRLGRLPGDPPPLFDQLRVDVIDEAGGLAERREFALAHEDFESGLVSFGIAPRVGATRVRLRMFRIDELIDGEPPPVNTIDALVRLGSIPDDTRTELAVFLGVDRIGQLAEPSAPEAYAAGTSQVGRWAGAQPRGCAGSPASDEVCVPGGAFFVGDPKILFRPSDVAPYPSRLARMSPFFLDQREVSVAELRARWSMLKAQGLPAPTARLEGGSPATFATYCTFTEAPSSTDGLPINCVPQRTALAYCESLGRTLPTEAQLQYAASGIGEERRYVWGLDPASCEGVVYGRGGGGGSTSLIAHEPDACRPSAGLGSPSPSGSGSRDRLSLVGGTVLDLAGNVGEWCLDRWAPIDGDYWTSRLIFDDPVATLDVDGRIVTHGGSWLGGAQELIAANRKALGESTPTLETGFRCARADGAPLTGP